MHPFWKLVLLGSVVGLGSGCVGSQGVRYVYQDGNFGVVGIPENTDRFPTHYRHKAEKLMEEHFPDGHEIVRAEEVVEGDRQLKVEGSRTAEVSPQVPASFISVAKIGHTASRTQADSVKIKECRIIYRRIGSPEVPTGFSTVADPTPTLYVDPNALERRKANGTETAEKPKDSPKPDTPRPASPTPSEQKADRDWG